MSISWGDIKVLLTFFGPILLPKALTCYQSLKSANSSTLVRPLPPKVLRVLPLLFVAILYFVLQTLPYFSPEEIISLTGSRIQTPNDVLFMRLSAIRSAGLTASDQILKSRFSSLNLRLLYLQYGPSTITECTFCNPEDYKSYFYYSIPSLLFPHLLNLVFLGILTSRLFTGRDGNVWRTQLNFIVISMCIVDLYLTFSFSFRTNSQARTSEDINFFYWNTRIYRHLAIAILDTVFGVLLYLSSTHRVFFEPFTISERINSLNSFVDEARSKVTAVGVIQNTVVRDKELSYKSQQYWTSEGQIIREAMETKEVIESIKSALENRIDMETIVTDADSYAQKILMPFYERANASLAT
ncbi:putative chorismate synthase protein [Erysiphe neolycopersici]|uniref:Putative chorismate synthase protein n=1 Tax=Erysiphe neolycopersici TaxID=212602 RepID=A0A420HZ54_9PEZI|nr:putative chorismate synthase protein [Erysiphe neolycopersici]